MVLTTDQRQILEAIPHDDGPFGAAIGEERLRELFPDAMHVLRQLCAEGYAAERSMPETAEAGDTPSPPERYYVRTPRGDEALA